MTLSLNWENDTVLIFQLFDEALTTANQRK